VHGTGVFAHKLIPAGARIWEFDPGMHVCDRDAMRALPSHELRFALHGGYFHRTSGLFLWYRDGMQYMNHATGQAANVGLTFWPPLAADHTVALRDIAAGEELFEDYTFWADGGLAADHWLYNLYLEHCPEHFAFLSRLGALQIAA